MVGVYPSSELNDEKLTMLMTGKKLEYHPFTKEVNHQQQSWHAKSYRGMGNIRISPFSCCRVRYGHHRLAWFRANGASPLLIWLNVS
jgi:hypothetical protein